MGKMENYIEKAKKIRYLDNQKCLLYLYKAESHAASSGKTLPVQFYCIKSEVHYSQEQYTEAIQCYNEAIRLDPTNAEYHYDKGEALYNKGEALHTKGKALRQEQEYDAERLLCHVEALHCYAEAIRLDPTNEKYYREKAFLHIMQSQYPEAIKCYDKLIQLNPTNAEYHCRKGDYLHYYQKRYAEAVKCYDEAIRLNPDEGYYRGNKGNAYLKDRQYAEAIKCFDEAIRLNPAEEGYHDAKGWALQRQQRYAEAVKCHEEAIRLNPKRVNFYYNKGFALYRQQCYVESIKCYNEAQWQEDDHDVAVIYYFKGKTLYAQQQYREAIECYNKAMQLDPNNEVILALRDQRYDDCNDFKHTTYYQDKSNALVAQGEYLDGINCLDEAIKLDLNNAGLLNHKSQILCLTGRYAEASALIEKALELDKESADIWDTRGYVLFLLGDWQGSALSFGKALQFDLGKSTSLQGKALIALQQKNIKLFQQLSSQVEVEIAKKSLPLNIELYSLKGEVLASLGHWEDAKRAWQKVLQIYPLHAAAPKKIQAISVNQQQPMTTSLEIEYSDLKIGENLGSGGFGRVSKGTYQCIPVAIKELHHTSPTDAAEFQAEASIMSKLRHPNIVQLYGICLGPYCLVMEFMAQGSLFDLLHGPKKAIDLPWSLRLKIAHEMTLGLLFLHSQKILHRDLKSMNVLLDEHSKAKLADFGLSQMRNEANSRYGKNQSVGTLNWMAPELFERGAKYTEKSDIYSLAIMYWEIAERKIPFAQLNDISQLPRRLLQGEREKISSYCPKALAQLIADCWQSRADQRPVASNIVERIERIKLDNLPSHTPPTQSHFPPFLKQNSQLISNQTPSTIYKKPPPPIPSFNRLNISGKSKINAESKTQVETMHLPGIQQSKFASYQGPLGSVAIPQNNPARPVPKRPSQLKTSISVPHLNTYQHNLFSHQAGSRPVPPPPKPLFKTPRPCPPQPFK